MARAAECVVRHDNYRVVIMDNSELLDRNLLDRVAEHVGVLEPDVRQQDDARADDVRGVVPAAEPCLDDGDVDACLGERVEGGGGDRLELRRTDALGCRANARQRRGEVRRQAVDPDPLAPRPHMWRERRPDGEAFGEQQLLDRDRSRRLPVRPDHVDGRVVRSCGSPSCGEQGLHPVEPEAVLGRFTVLPSTPRRLITRRTPAPRHARSPRPGSAVGAGSRSSRRHRIAARAVARSASSRSYAVRRCSIRRAFGPRPLGPASRAAPSRRPAPPRTASRRCRGEDVRPRTRRSS